MALKSTIFKVRLQIADMDRSHYQTYYLTIARHPSETDERMMARIIAFALHADDNLEFTKGLSTENEPDVWQLGLSGEIIIWIELGQPDVKRIRKACGRASHVFIYTYSQRAADVWWRQTQGDVNRFNNLSVISLPEDAVKSLAKLTKKSMQLQCTIHDGHMWLGDSSESISINLDKWKDGETSNYTN
ncbi:YaeQ family protein [Kaarinaea lacus]